MARASGLRRTWRRAAAALLCAASAACPDSGPRAGPWNRPAGEGLAIVDYTLSGGSDYFDGQGRLAPARRYDKGEAAAYVEYGLTDALTLLARPVTGKNRWQLPGLCGINWDWPILPGKGRSSAGRERIGALPGGKIRWRKPRAEVSREGALEAA